MRYIRIWFVALLAAALLREEPVFSVERTPWQPPSVEMWIELNMTEPEDAPPMPEPKPWRSFLDQTTGTWIK